MAQGLASGGVAGALVAYIYAAATVGSATNGGLAETAGRVAVAVVLGIAFFWWGLRFLIGGRVSYLAAMPGAVATKVGLAGLRAFSGLVFEPLIVRNAVSYGALGTVLIVQSWLIGVGWVVYACELFGRWFHDSWLQGWVQRRRDHTESGGEEDEQRPGSRGPSCGERSGSAARTSSATAAIPAVVGWYGAPPRSDRWKRRVHGTADQA